MFYDELRCDFYTVEDTREILLMGDFNGRTGTKFGDRVVGRHREVQINDNGKTLVDFCNPNILKITSGFFRHKNIHIYTWTQ